MRRFVAENAALYGLTASQARQLQIVADYTNPAGNLSWVEYEQRINGIPVFQGYLRAEVTRDGRLWRTTGNLAAGLDYTQLPTTGQMTPTAAAIAAAKTIGVEVFAPDLRTLSVDSKSHMTKLAQGPFTEEIKVELVYFAVEPGLATLAYSMVLWEPHDAYWVLVDANDGSLLWRKNITNDQTQSVTYSVYDDDSPTPLSPSNALPGSGIQGTPISRSTITNISELPAFDNLGWITDGAGNAVTTGNNVDAGLDIDGTNGIDATGRATAVGRVFNFAYAPGGTAGEEAPTSTNYRMGIVTNIFFWTNRYHDRIYQYGFTEPARNFQNNNFGRGGLGADFVRAEAQDSVGHEQRQLFHACRRQPAAHADVHLYRAHAGSRRRSRRRCVSARDDARDIESPARQRLGPCDHPVRRDGRGLVGLLRPLPALVRQRRCKRHLRRGRVRNAQFHQWRHGRHR